MPRPEAGACEQAKRQSRQYLMSQNSHRIKANMNAEENLHMQTETMTVAIKVDAAPAFAELASLLREISSLGELAAKCLEQGVELVALDGDLAAAPAANDCRTVLKPTDQLVLFVGALRACNRDARALIHFE